MRLNSLFKIILFLVVLLNSCCLAYAVVYDYDDSGRLKSILYDSGEEVKLEYDRNGNLLSKKVNNVGFQVYSSSPVDGSTGVWLDSPVRITFNRDIDRGTNFNGICLKDSSTVVDATYSIDNNVVIITPKNKLTPYVLYSVYLPTGAVKDLVGNPNPSPYAIGFKTTSDVINPKISGTSPQNGTQFVQKYNDIWVVFSEEIRALDFANITLKSGSTSVPCNYSYGTFAKSGSPLNSIIIEPISDLSENVIYSVYIPEGSVRDLSGNKLQQGYSFNFKTSENKVEMISNAESVSSSGRFILYSKDGNSTILDRTTGSTQIISVSSNGQLGDKWSSAGVMSSNEKHVVLRSSATNLVESDLNLCDDIFIRDLTNGTTKIVSLSYNGNQANRESTNPSVDSSGRFVVFESRASNLTPDDNDNINDIFVRDLQNNTTKLVSVSSNGIKGNADSTNPKISADGKYVVYTSNSTNLVSNKVYNSNVYIFDTEQGTTRLVQLYDDIISSSYGRVLSSISEDGRYIVVYSFMATGSKVPESIKQLYVYNQITGAVTKVGVSVTGVPSTGASKDGVISKDGRYVAFWSNGNNLVPGDKNNAGDVFIRDLVTGDVKLISVSNCGIEGNYNSERPLMSSDGRTIIFDSLASNLVPGDTNTIYDKFIYTQ